jgi:hypothetical protein
MIRVKFPFSSVNVPAPDPLTVMEAADTISPVLLLMFPLIVVLCAKANIEIIFAIKKAVR